MSLYRVRGIPVGRKRALSSVSVEEFRKSLALALQECTTFEEVTILVLEAEQSTFYNYVAGNISKDDWQACGKAISENFSEEQKRRQQQS